MSYNSLRSKHQQRGILLTIEGLGVRYYLGSAPGTLNYLAAHEGYPSVAYIDIEGIQSVSPIEESIDIKGGVGHYSTVQIELATCGDCAGVYDPAYVFGRLGRKGADWWGLLIEEIDDTDTTIKVDREPPSSLLGEVIHIGRESIRVGNIEGLGTGLSPYRFTSCNRGVGGTQSVPYLVRTDTGNQPSITSPLCNFRGRRCTISIDGGDGYVEYLIGEISDVPNITDSSVSLSITPLPATLDNEISIPIARETALVQGYHCFKPPYARYLSHVQKAGSASFGTGTGISANEIQVDDLTAQTSYDVLFDRSLDVKHPRHGFIYTERQGFADSVIGFSAGNVFSTYNTVTIGADYGTVYSGRTNELHLADMIQGALDDDGHFVTRWPEGAEGACRIDWVPSDTQDLDGAWANVQLILAGEAPKVMVSNNLKLMNGAPAAINVEFAQEGINWRDVYDWSANGAPFHPSDDLLCQYPFTIGQPTLGIDVPWDEEWFSTPIGEVAIAWYQKGEAGIFVNPLPDGSAPVTLYDGKAIVEVWQGEEKWNVEVVGVYLKKNADDSPLGYYLEFSDADRDVLPSIGDWPSSEAPVKVKQILALRRVGWGTFIKEFLSAPKGSTIPYGPNLKQYLQRFWPDDGLGKISPSLPDDKTPNDLISPYLLATSHSLVIKRNDFGNAYLGLTYMGLETVNTVRYDIQESDCLDVSQETTGDEDIVNVVKVYTDYNKDDEAQTQVTINDNDSISLFGVQNDLELELRGVKSSPGVDGQLKWVGLASHITALHGSPRRVWRLRVHHGIVLGLALGDIVRVTHSALRAYVPQRGVTGLLGIVIGITVDPMNAAAELVILHTGFEGSGWNTALLVRSIESSDTVTVYSSTYSDDDMSRWGSGDTCVVRSGSTPTSAYTVTTIDSITAHYTGGILDYYTVTFADNHDLIYAQFSYIEPPIYTSATQRQQILAYLSDPATNLISAGVQAYALG